jgi:hypothetical protein
MSQWADTTVDMGALPRPSVGTSRSRVLTGRVWGIVEDGWLGCGGDGGWERMQAGAARKR